MVERDDLDNSDLYKKYARKSILYIVGVSIVSGGIATAIVSLGSGLALVALFIPLIAIIFIVNDLFKQIDSLIIERSHDLNQELGDTGDDE